MSNDDINKQQIDLNTTETVEYQKWLQILEGICSIQSALKDNPNAKGLKQARSKAYNVLADIQMLMDSLDNQEK